MYRRSFRIFVVVLFMSIVAASTGAGAQSLTAGASASSGSVHSSPPGSPIHEGTQEIGFSLGAGIGTQFLGDTRNHDIVLGAVRYGYVFTDRLAPEKWYAGNFEIIAEIFGGDQFNPNGRQFTGLTGLFRYDFEGCGPWVPFVDVGGGVAWTNIGYPDLSQEFNFNLQLGVGLHYFLTDSWAMTFQARHLHLSNAGLHTPNKGVNSEVFMVGVTRFF